jgi:hypothetical protein
MSNELLWVHILRMEFFKMLDHVVMPNSVNEGSNSATFLASDRRQRQVTQLTFERDIVTGPVVRANVSIWVPECVGIRAG